MSDEMITVKTLYREDENYLVRCPHCKIFLNLLGDSPEDIRGEQYFDEGCAGWVEVAHNARIRKAP